MMNFEQVPGTKIMIGSAGEGQVPKFEVWLRMWRKAHPEMPATDAEMLLVYKQFYPDPNDYVE